MRITISGIVCAMIAAIGLGAISVRPTHQEAICTLVLEDHVRSRSFPTLIPTPAYGVYFIDVVSSSESNMIWAAFKTNWPTVVIGTNRLWIPEGAVYMDRVTGLNARVFNAKVTFYDFPNAKARSIASSARMGAEAFNYTLLHTNGQWTIVKKQNGGYALQNRRLTNSIVAR